MEGKKILVTGPTGQVAFPLACTLAKSNEVWGAARFSDAKKKAALEAAGVTCVATDLGSGEFDGLPTDFDYVLHLAVARGATPDFDGDLRANAEAAGLLMAHCRRAKAFLHCSTTGVYQPKDHEPIVESDPLGDNHRVMMPTYSIAKIAAEAVVRYAARQLGLPTVIARLNTPYGNNGGWMYYHLLMMKNGVDITVHSDAPSVYTPIHEDDIARVFPALLAHAKVPAEIVNVSGQEHVSIEEWCAYLGELCGLEPKFVKTEATLESVMSDNAKMVSLVGPARVSWKDGLRRLVEARHPDWLVAR
ncbi:MAG: NAD(P)-dependent oxidoreductase [Myxococcota bacterium]|nr:NAD(P)-dependent oxidoreductase [Myxococcales bacterium]